MSNNEWKKVCAACAEGTPPERCAYYGDPNGCNAPTIGAHPEGDLAERLQDELADAHDAIARLEAELAETRRERDTLAAEREMDEATRTHIPHEPLADVLVAMRRYADIVELGPTPIGRALADLFREYADRIEAAAERERDEDRQLAAIAESDEAFARCARCDRPERAPVNAAAMRDELNELDLDAHRMRWDRKYRDKREAGNFVERVIDTIRRALAATARNCDVSRTKREAKMEYDSRHDAEYGSKDDFVDWLFRPAEGGAE